MLQLVTECWFDTPVYCALLQISEKSHEVRKEENVNDALSYANQGNRRFVIADGDKVRKHPCWKSLEPIEWKSNEGLILFQHTQHSHTFVLLLPPKMAIEVFVKESLEAAGKLQDHPYFQDPTSKKLKALTKAIDCVKTDRRKAPDKQVLSPAISAVAGKPLGPAFAVKTAADWIEQATKDTFDR